MFLLVPVSQPKTCIIKLLKRVSVKHLPCDEQQLVILCSLSLSAETCAFSCLNGGRCVQSESCDCSLYQASGHRCQTGSRDHLTFSFFGTFFGLNGVA